MKELKIASLSGKGYKLGIEFSKLFNGIDDDFSYYSNLLKDVSIREKLEIVKEKLKNVYPEYLEEVYGRADGFNVDRDEYLLNICFEIYESREACTDVFVKVSNDCILLGHNEDLPETLDEMCLIKYSCDNVTFCELSTYNCMQGTTFGWNNYGIVYSVNSIHLLENNEIGIPIWFILRDIVNSKNIDEVIKRLNILDCASAFNLNIMDCNTNKVYSIEKVLDKLSVFEIKDKYVHTNHLIHDDVNKELCETYNSTLIRLYTANKLLNNLNVKNAKLENIKDILQFDDGENEHVFRKFVNDESPTVATFLCNSYTKEILIYSYYDNKVIKGNVDNI